MSFVRFNLAPYGKITLMYIQGIPLRVEFSILRAPSTVHGRTNSFSFEAIDGAVTKVMVHVSLSLCIRHLTEFRG